MDVALIKNLGKISCRDPQPRISSHFMQLKCSFPPLEESATGPYLESEKSTEKMPSFFRTISILPCHSPFTSASSKWRLSFRFPYKNSVCISLLFCACYVPHPSHPAWFDYHSDICQRLKIMKPHIMRLSVISYYYVCTPHTVGSKYCPFCAI